MSSAATCGKTLLAGSEPGFVWSAVAHLHGIPGMPEWANWFAEELKAHRAVAPAIGIGCRPTVIKANKEQMLDWLRWGVESDAIAFPSKSGSILWPDLSLRDIFP